MRTIPQLRRSHPLRRLPAAALCTLALLLSSVLAVPAMAQVIEFESGGLQYQTLSREGLTIMLARLPVTLRTYSVVQVSVANGSARTVTVKPEDFSVERESGGSFAASPASDVVREFIRNPNRDDVIKLVGTYEMSLYGMATTHTGSRNGYETRRQSALAELSFKNLKAAAAASAIAFVKTELQPGQTTDGAVFFPSARGSLSDGRIVVRIEDGTEFAFKRFSEPPASQ